MDGVRLFPMREMARRFDRHEPRARYSLQQLGAELDWNRVVLFSPERQNRPGMFADAFQLGLLVDLGVADDG